MRTSERGIKFIRGWEGCELKAYKDSGGKWTIGVGHTPAKPGQTITQFEADEMFRLDVEEREPELERILGGAATTQWQWDALISLAFNIGMERLKNSTVMKRHKLGNPTGAANAFLMWKYVDGKIVPGLLRRREAERLLYLGEAR